MKLSFWFDFASTYSYLAAMRFESACLDAGVVPAYKPFLLGPIFQELHNIKDSPFNVQPVRGKYMWRDLQRLCEKYALPFRKPGVFPRQSVLAGRVGCCAGEQTAQVVKAIFQANFAEDLDIASPEVLGEIVGKDLVELAQTPEVKAQLRANTDEARQLGIFGAPDFVAEGELFFGHDRMDDALAWCKRS